MVVKVKIEKETGENQENQENQDFFCFKNFLTNIDWKWLTKKQNSKEVLCEKVEEARRELFVFLEDLEERLPFQLHH